MLWLGSEFAILSQSALSEGPPNRYMLILVGTLLKKSHHFSMGYCLVYHNDAGATHIYVQVVYAFVLE